MTDHSSCDVVILGGGHNGLVASAYLAKAGLNVHVLERKPYFGGAAISAKVFDGVDVNLSQYAYLLSLLPAKIIKDLHLNIQSRQRTTASYSPFHHTNNQISGLHISNANPEITQQSFLALTGSTAEYQKYLTFNQRVSAFADIVFPTLLEPLRSRESFVQMCEQASPEAKLAWQNFVEEPLNVVIEDLFAHDLVRGTIYTDGKIGVFAAADDERLLQNRTFIYHVIGTDWRVPVGGMGAVSNQLLLAAQKAGAVLASGATVTHVSKEGETFTTTYQHNDHEITIESRFVLSNVAPQILDHLMMDYQAPASADGSVFKMNLVLERLPEIKDPSVTTIDALTGTFHFNEGYEALQVSYAEAQAGHIPQQPAGEMYCHSLTDDSIVGESGYHTLTLFGLDMPYRNFLENNDEKREQVKDRYLEAISKFFEAPIQDFIAKDANDNLCIEAKTPLDIERDLNMPTGNIFHNDLSWFWGEEGQWGVETDIEGLLICGSGAMRGGAVSGISGHNAAMKVLELLKK